MDNWEWLKKTISRWASKFENGMLLDGHTAARVSQSHYVLELMKAKESGLICVDCVRGPTRCGKIFRPTEANTCEYFESNLKVPRTGICAHLGPCDCAKDTAPECTRGGEGECYMAKRGELPAESFCASECAAYKEPEWKRYQLKVENLHTSPVGGDDDLLCLKWYGALGRVTMQIDKALFSVLFTEAAKLRKPVIDAQRTARGYAVRSGTPGVDYKAFHPVPAATFEALFEEVPSPTARLSDEVPGRVECSIPFDPDADGFRKRIAEALADWKARDPEAYWAYLQENTPPGFPARAPEATPPGVDWDDIERFVEEGTHAKMTAYPPPFTDRLYNLFRAVLELRESLEGARDEIGGLMGRYNHTCDRLDALEKLIPTKYARIRDVAGEVQSVPSFTGEAER